MIITHKLQPMDMTASGVPQRVDVMQDDKYSRNLEFTLNQNGMAWPIPDGTTAVVRYRKSDGTGGNYDTLPDGSLAYSFSGNVLTIALAPQVCTASGLVTMAVGLILGEAEINTFAVNICVHCNPGINVLSEDYINVHFITRLEQLEQAVSDLLYSPIDFEYIGREPDTAEIGSTVNTVTISWVLNKTPVELTLNGETLDTSRNSFTFFGLSLTENQAWTVIAIDERGADARRTVWTRFYNGVYYGVSEVPEAIDSEFILGLTKVLSGGKISSFTVNAGVGEYIWYAVPSRFGSCNFNVGGFYGGFDLVAEIDFSNASGYTERYNIYRSANAGLGNTTVEVT